MNIDDFELSIDNVLLGVPSHKPTYMQMKG